ncbi:MAG: tannase/feruloyl esterase family alpha/beta hydrolase [Flavobacteriaceae bacterium]|nr:MAG: tannase/feruloyl esterase family alpha/beta hydrolase [Flavobacteriaceae bacterium]
MKTKIITILIIFVSIGLIADTMKNESIELNSFDPEKLKDQINMSEVTISSITQESEYAPHVKVAGVIGKNIKFELLLPDNWNGKFVMGGGGGFAGSVINFALTYGAVERGYATVGTDTGHEGNPLDGSWALNDMEAITNFGHLAVHRTAVNAKAMIEKYYQKEIDFSYFLGCSRGGGQALMEAQRYPEDFDGIVAGAPAYNWTHGMAATMVHNMKYMYPNPDDLNEPMISKSDLELIERTYLELYDELDGIKDGIINDPSVVNFDVDVELIMCEGEKTANCLTEEQIEVLRAIYTGATDPCGNPLFYGLPIGGETDEGGWFKWLTGGFNNIGSVSDFQAGVTSEFEPPHVPNIQYGFGTEVMKNLIFHDSSWTYKDYNFENFDDDSRLAAHTLNATSPDLSEFRSRGGKLLMYTGWSDVAISAYGTIGYYEDVVAHDPSAVDDVKLYMMPGVLHCLGGNGPWFINWIDEIDKWVAGNNSPEELTVYFVDENMEPDGSRLLCPYPSVPQYDGQGNPRDVKSFVCD